MSADLALRDRQARMNIDPAELHRVFPPVTARSDTDDGTVQRFVPPDETAMLQREVELLREVVADLRGRLDSAERRLDAALGMLEAAQPPRLEDRSWTWRWWKRGQ